MKETIKCLLFEIVRTSIIVFFWELGKRLF